MQKQLKWDMPSAKILCDACQQSLTEAASDVHLMTLRIEGTLYDVTFIFTLLGRVGDRAAINLIVEALPDRGDEFHEYEISVPRASSDGNWALSVRARWTTPRVPTLPAYNEKLYG